MRNISNPHERFSLSAGSDREEINCLDLANRSDEIGTGYWRIASESNQMVASVDGKRGLKSSNVDRIRILLINHDFKRAG